MLKSYHRQFETVPLPIREPVGRLPVIGHAGATNRGSTGAGDISAITHIL